MWNCCYIFVSTTHHKIYGVQHKLITVKWIWEQKKKRQLVFFIPAEENEELLFINVRKTKVVGKEILLNIIKGYYLLFLILILFSSNKYNKSINLKMKILFNIESTLDDWSL